MVVKGIAGMPMLILTILLSLVMIVVIIAGVFQMTAGEYVGLGIVLFVIGLVYYCIGLPLLCCGTSPMPSRLVR